MGGLLQLGKLLWSIIRGMKSSSSSTRSSESSQNNQPVQNSQPPTKDTTPTIHGVGVSSFVPSSRCIALIKEFEGCKLEAYQDAVGIPTIGYGHTQGVVLGTKITQEEAEALLISDLKSTASQVRTALQIPVNQNQFDALCSFTFNVGIGSLARSTLLKKINAGNIKEAGAEFERWINAGGKPLAGLIRRRKAERALFEAQA